MKLSRFAAVCGAICLIFFAAFGAAAGKEPPLPAVREGDIVFQVTEDEQSGAIARATESPWTHTGLVFFQDGKPFVIEASGPVHYTALKTWLNRGLNGKYAIKRLKEADKILTPEALVKLRAAAEKFKGLPYDAYFGWGDDSIYCSELVWKSYERGLKIKLGELRKMRSFKLDDPVVKHQLAKRYGDEVPLDEDVVPPSVVHDSPLLVTVAEK